MSIVGIWCSDQIFMFIATRKLGGQIFVVRLLKAVWQLITRSVIYRVSSRTRIEFLLDDIMFTLKKADL